MKNKIIERIAYHAAMLCVVAFFFVGICALASAAEHFPIVTSLVSVLVIAAIGKRELKPKSKREGVYRHGK